MSKNKWSSYWHFQSSECTQKTSKKIPVLKKYFQFYIPNGIKMDNGEWLYFPRNVFEIKCIAVEGVQYPFLTIRFWDGDWGCDICPTTLILKEIIDIIGTESVHSFWEWHNCSFPKLLSVLGEGEIRSMTVYSATYELCKRINFSFDKYCYYNSIIFYCESIFWKGEYSINKQIERNKAYAGAFNKYVLKGIIEPEMVQEGFTQANWLRQITDYSKAKSVLDICNELLNIVLKTDKEVINLIHKREQEKQEFLKIVKDSKCIDHERFKPPAICRFCGKWINAVTRFPSSCGSDECDRRYEQDKKSRQRGSTTTDGWVCVHKRATCKGCTRRVQVNEDFLCRSCYTETLL